MALTLTTNAPDFPFCVIVAGGAQLPPEAAGVTVTADPAGVVIVSLDPAPVTIQNPFDPAHGTRSVASGVVNPTAKGNATITAKVLKADGSTLAEVSDTVNVVDPGPGIAQWAGSLFGSGATIALP